MKPSLSECREKQVRPRETPDYLALGAGSDTRYEKCGRRAIHRPRSAAGKFMQRAVCKASAWKATIDIGDPER
jgi:hypothetical protein